MQELTVGETITEIARPIVLPLLEIEEPTVKMQFMSNNGPFAGKEGKYVTSRNLRDRLFKEIKSNVALRVERDRVARHLRGAGPRRAAPDGAHRDDAARGLRADGVAAAGHLQDRRRPARSSSPTRRSVIDLDEAFSGAVIEELGRRGGRMQEMGPAGEGRMRLEYLCPARGLIGYRSQFLTDTRGTGILNHNFKNYGPYAGAIRSRPNGVLIVAGRRRDQHLRPVLPAGARAAVPGTGRSRSTAARSSACTRATTTWSSTRRRPRS